MNKFDFQNITVVSVTYQSKMVIEELASTLNYFEHVIIVDNASSDSTTKEISHFIPHAKIIINASNLGFGAGNNIGIQQVETEYTLIFNPDCKLAIHDVENLLDAAELYPNAALIAPQGFHADGKIQPSYRAAFYEKRKKSQYAIPDGICSAKWLHGCCILIRTQAFKKFGGFDTRFFLFFEDDDLCLKSIKSGYDCILQPAANVIHLGGKSSTPSIATDLLKQFHWARSRFHLIDKYEGHAKALRYRLKIALASPFAIIIYALILRKKYVLKWLGWAFFAWRLNGK